MSQLSCTSIKGLGWGWKGGGEGGSGLAVLFPVVDTKGRSRKKKAKDTKT
jgi:hypothetical protein